MPRKLPWLVEGAKEKDKKKRASSSSPPSKHDRESSPDDLVDSDLNALAPSPPKRKQNVRRDRTPSTSPPPAPPDAEYMREGYNADDIFRMVEDEFLSTAKTFTQHIHHAEYVRLKKLAKSRGAGTLRSINRATDGRTEQSTELKLKKEAEETARRQRDGLNDAESSEDEDAYMQDPQLADLMTSEGRTGKNLSAMAKARANTRAAAGFAQSLRNVERTKDVLSESTEITKDTSPSRSKKAYQDVYSTGDEDDDLDAHPSKGARPTYKLPEMNRNIPARKEIAAETNSGFFKKFANPSNDDRQDDTLSFRRKREPVSASSMPAAPASNDSELSTLRPSSTVTTISAHDFVAKRRAEKEKKEREEKRKAQAVDDIPTFLF